MGCMEKKNNAWYQPVAKEGPAGDRSAGVVDNAGASSQENQVASKALHNTKNAGLCGAVPKACAGAPGGLAQTTLEEQLQEAVAMLVSLQLSL